MADGGADDGLVVGFAGRRYRVERPWGRLPAGKRLGALSAVACDSRDRVYAFQRYDPDAGERGPAITVFGPDGGVLAEWGEGAVKDAHHMFISADDRVFLVDRDAHQVLVFDADGTPLMALGERDRPDRPFNHPTSVAVGPAGDVYVADGYGATHVHRFAPDGRHVATWGRPGHGPGEFTTPHGIWVLGDGRVLVGDRENNRLQAFDPDGRWLADWTGGFYHPMSIWADRAGTVYVSDQIPRLTAFSAAGVRLGACRPVLNGGHGMYGDGQGHLYFAELRPNRISRLVPLAP